MCRTRVLPTFTALFLISTGLAAQSANIPHAPAFYGDELTALPTYGWITNASGFVPGPSADFPPNAPPTLVFRMWPTVYPIPFHYENPATE